MKHGIDTGLTSDAKTALASKGVAGVDVNSDWASLTLKGQASTRAAALAAVHGMGNAGAVNTVTYICTGATPCPGTPGSGTPAGAAGSAPASSPSAGPSSSVSASASGAATAAPSATASASPSSSPSPSGSGSAGSGSGGSAGSAAGLEAQIRQALGKDGVTFGTGSTSLTSHAKAVLNQVAALLAKAPGLKVAIAGYTDNQGSASSNLALSQGRARATRDYLAARGVAGNRMTAVGYGAAHPVATNATAAGRSANRRIEFTVQGG